MQKRTMTSRQWLIALGITCLMLFFGMILFNYVMDPFGAFGDPYFSWWSYNETLNPRVAKISYLEQNHGKYDSYIIGCSSTSSYPVEQLNSYFDANFYNLIMYGSDMYDVELTSEYIVEHYEVKNLVVNVYIQNAEYYQTESDPLTYGMHYKVDHTSEAEYWAKYLLANPQYASEKLRLSFSDGYLQQSHDVFDEETGAYDKSRRDAERIDSLESYLKTYPAFANYPKRTKTLPNLEKCMASLGRIKRLCEENGIRFMVLCTPMYHENFKYYSMEDVEAFATALAEVTPYWDFMYSSVSYDPRYFYDETHFRNAVGEMALARAFGDEAIYVPEDFGIYVTSETVPALMEHYRNVMPLPESAYTTQVPILLYHHLTEENGKGDSMTTDHFRAHMEAIAEAGYTAVTFEMLQDYVQRGADLPEKPIVITFDDGYESNLTLAAPILREYGLNATVFAIGVSIGKDTYKDSDYPITPHFSLEQAAEYFDVIQVESHGYNLHEVSNLDPAPIREGAMQKSGETEEAYLTFLRQDCRAMDEIFQEAYGRKPKVFAYPYGMYSMMSEVLMRECGMEITLTTERRINTLVKGLDQSLLQMGRFTVYDETTVEELMEILNQ